MKYVLFIFFVMNIIPTAQGGKKMEAWKERMKDTKIFKMGKSVSDSAKRQVNSLKNANDERKKRSLEQKLKDYEVHEKHYTTKNGGVGNDHELAAVAAKKAAAEAKIKVLDHKIEKRGGTPSSSETSSERTVNPPENGTGISQHTESRRSVESNYSQAQGE